MNERSKNEDMDQLETVRQHKRDSDRIFKNSEFDQNIKKTKKSNLTGNFPLYLDYPNEKPREHSPVIKRGLEISRQ